MRFIKSLAPGLRKTQTTNLALLASSIIMRRSLSLSELAVPTQAPNATVTASRDYGAFLEIIAWSGQPSAESLPASAIP